MQTEKRSKLNSVELYKVAPNSRQFFERIRDNSNLEKIARKIVRRSILVPSQEKIFNSAIERDVAHSLLSTGKVSFEPMSIPIPEMKAFMKSDFFPNVYVNHSMLSVEVHGFQWRINQKRLNEDQASVETNFYVNKVKRAKELYPEISYVFVSDMPKFVLEQKYKIDVESFCQAYLYMPSNVYHVPTEFPPAFKKLLREIDAKREENHETWIRDLTKIVSKVLKNTRAIRLEIEKDRGITI